MSKAFGKCLHAALAACLLMAFEAARARELAPVDALLAAPGVAAKEAAAVPDSVRQLRRDSRLGTAVFVSVDPARRLAADQRKQWARRDPVSAAREEFKSLAPLYGVSATELDTAPAQLQKPLDSGAQMVRFTNQRDGIPVFREQATVLLNGQNQLLNIGGAIGGTGLAAPTAKSAAANPLSAAAAAQKALDDFDFSTDVISLFSEPVGEADAGGYRRLDLPATVKGARGAVLEEPIRYRATWFRMPQGLLAAYYMELRVREDGEHHAYAYVIDSGSGEILFRNSMISHDAVSYTYGVWADPQTGVPYRGAQGMDLSPYPASGPNGYSPGMAAPSRITLANAPFSKNDPWVDSSVNATLSFSVGNNVRVFGDVKSPDGDGGAPLSGKVFCSPNASSVNADFYACTASQSFDYGYDFSAGALANLGQASSSVSNMFYVINWLHDWFYDVGFDEAAGNAQASNFGRGGLENDAISARALNYIGMNNASMDTPADGGTPIMRAYVYNRGSPTRSAALDNTIVIHEWSHFLSNRLIGNGAGLSARQAAGLGEGWGDFLAQLVTVTEQERLKPGNDHYQGAYAHAAYANGATMAPALDQNNASYFGSRRFPYSTDFAVNPLTFKHIQDDEPLPGGAPVNAPLIASQAQNGVSNSELHNTGEVWAGMLWECYAGMLNARPFSEARQHMKSYLVAGMKLTPVNPSLLEARDALLAVMAANDPQDYAACLTGFARRGAGLGAQGPDRYSTSNKGVVESFDAGPMLVVEAAELSMSQPGAMTCDGDANLDNGETAQLLVTVVNRGNVAVSGASLDLRADEPLVRFPGGNVLAMDGAIESGQSRVMAAPVYVSGLNGYVRATFSVNVVMPQDQPGAAMGRSIQAWLNADITQNSASSDTADFPDAGMVLGSANWSIVSGDAQNWYQASVPGAKGSHVLYSPWLRVDAQSDFVLTFDQQYDFGLDDTNGGQLTIAEEQKPDTALPRDRVAYNGSIWPSRGDVANTNPLRSQPAFVRRSGGWQRDVTVNLGRVYAGRTVRIGWRLGTSELAPSPETQFWRVDNLRFSGLKEKPFSTIEANARFCTILTPVGDGGSDPLAVQLTDVSGQPVEISDVGITFRGPGGDGDVATVLSDELGQAASPFANASAGDALAGVSLAGAVPIVSRADGAAAPAEARATALDDKAGASAVQARAIPTLSQWGLWMLALLVGLLGAAAARRGRA